jgi:hypothetical protein
MQANFTCDALRDDSNGRCVTIQDRVASAVSTEIISFCFIWFNLHPQIDPNSLGCRGQIEDAMAESENYVSCSCAPLVRVFTTVGYTGLPLMSGLLDFDFFYSLF